MIFTSPTVSPVDKMLNPSAAFNGSAADDITLEPAGCDSASVPLYPRPVTSGPMDATSNYVDVRFVYRMYSSPMTM